ncbi:hypothetical protein BH23GEM6_BH23GEM6_16130 [soil metagenome]
MDRPSPGDQIRLVSLRNVRGPNFWAKRPVTRLDLSVGVFDDLSSADVPGTTEALLAALPGLIEHRCSLGERAGFLTRLRRGTYAPHIIEHVALELQSVIGHEVGYGRARGGDRPGEYTVVFEHVHAEVGLRAAVHALQIVQQAFAGRRPRVENAIAELRSLASFSDQEGTGRTVSCGVTGGGDLGVFGDELLRRGLVLTSGVVSVTPAYLLNVGLPYGTSATAVILDAEIHDVPDRYRDPEMARRLLSVIADAVQEGGWVIAPASESQLLDLLRAAERRLALFQTAEEADSRALQSSDAAAQILDGRIMITSGDRSEDAGPLDDGVPVAAQMAAALMELVGDQKRIEHEQRKAIYS